MFLTWFTTLCTPRSKSVERAAPKPSRGGPGSLGVQRRDDYPRHVGKLSPVAPRKRHGRRRRPLDHPQFIRSLPEASPPSVA
jgi:hypothetical protein